MMVGRPEIGRPVNLRLGEDLLAEVDAYATDHDVKRPEAVRRLIRLGLQRRPGRGKRTDLKD